MSTTPQFALPGLMPLQPVNVTVSLFSTAVVINQLIEKGVEWTKEYAWSAGDPPARVDLTGWEGVLWIRKYYSSPVDIGFYTAEGGRVVLGGDTGTITVTLFGPDIELLPTGVFVYGLDLINPSDKVHKFMRGNLRVID